MMKDNYKRTFDAIHLPEERQKEIRSTLSSYTPNKEENILKKKFKLNSVIAATLLLFLVLSGFAFGDKVIHLLGGGQLKEGKDENGNSFVSMDMGFATNPVDISNGNIFFILDDSNLNITEQCSDKTYFQYENIDENGIRHVVVVGGTPENIGWAEFVWDEEGNLSNNATYSGEKEPEWLIRAKEVLE